MTTWHAPAMNGCAEVVVLDDEKVVFMWHTGPGWRGSRGPWEIMWMPANNLHQSTGSCYVRYHLPEMPR